MFPEWAAHYTLARAYLRWCERLGARAPRARAYGARWPTLEDSWRLRLRAVVRRSSDSAAWCETGGPKISRAPSPRTKRRSRGIRPSVRPTPNLISLYGRQQKWRRPRRTTGPCWRLAGTGGHALRLRRPLGLQAPRGCRGVVAEGNLDHRSMRVATKPGKVSSAAEASPPRAYRRAVESQPLFRLARLTSAHL